MTTIQHIFGRPRALIGMVHIGATPGSPRYGGSISRLIEDALRDAGTLAEAGFDGLLLENMHDVPYLHRAVGPEVVATMTAVGAVVRGVVELPMGIQVLAGANEAALAVAHAVGANFIRAEGFVFSHIADEGLMNADAGTLLRYRRSIDAEDVRVFVDVKKKHSSHAITSDISIADTVRAAEFFAADGVVVTGTETGRPVEEADLRAAREATTLPVLVGSGVTPETVGTLFEHADALIVGSWCKVDGVWSNEVDMERARAVVNAMA